MANDRALTPSIYWHMEYFLPNLDTFNFIKAQLLIKQF